jgi:hypothetical protein
MCSLVVVQLILGDGNKFGISLLGIDTMSKLLFKMNK